MIDEKTDTLSSIEGVVAELISEFSQETPKVAKRLKKYIKKFNERFSNDPKKHGGATALTWALLGEPLQMYAVGHNSAVFVELHGLLERYVLRDLPAHLACDNTCAEIIAGLIERKTLPELADALETLGIWSKTDVTFAKRLTNIRNGIAHKNATLLSKQLGSGKDMHLLATGVLIDKTDCIPFLLDSTELLIKLSLSHAKHKQPNLPNQ